MLSEVVEHTVLLKGGEVVNHERAVKSGLMESLRMSVAIPGFWGIPPEVDTLSNAVKQGGGIVDKVYRRFLFH
jgi:hypothetical protein